MQEYDDGEFCRQAGFGAGGTGSVYADGGGIQLSQHTIKNYEINYYHVKNVELKNVNTEDVKT